MKPKTKSFRVGRVTAYLRGKVWYLCYYENGKRHRPRVGVDKAAARQLAAQTNAQLEFTVPAPLSFEPVGIAELRERWLHHHECVLRSSVATVRRYRTASAHLLEFARGIRRVVSVAHFRAGEAEAFAAYLRHVEVAPNGHRNARKRLLRDKGVKYVLEVCRSLFNYAAKRRHLPPYSENPFSAIEIDRMPIEDAKPFVGLTAGQERAFLGACDAWQFPIFLTLLLTGVRPGELTHALLPDDLDLDGGWLSIRNKPELGWKVKTRNERMIPLVPELADVLRAVIAGRTTGPVFLRRGYLGAQTPPLSGLTSRRLEVELARRIDREQRDRDLPLSREQAQRIATRLWRDMGTVKTDRIRTAFMQLTKRIGLSSVTAPKTLRHMFATALQDANVDPLIRNQLMGHVPAQGGCAGGGLGMTGVYTHTRPETLRRQLETALRGRPAAQVARSWLQRRRGAVA